MYQKDEAVDQHCVSAIQYLLDAGTQVLGTLSIQPEADWSFSLYLQAERHQKGGGQHQVIT